MGKPQRAAAARGRRLLILAAAAVAASTVAALAGCSAHPNLGKASDTTPPIAGSASDSTPGQSSGPSSGSRPPSRPIWQPRPGLTWQWQLTEPVDTSVDAQVYDIDGTENAAAVVSGLRAAGRKVICYVNAGAAESFRPDAERIPPSVIGLSNGWPGERWLDVRRLRVLRPVIAARFQACADKGFDGIEADNVDGYQNDTGFPLSAADQLAYNRMLSELAHADGLAIGLKNDLDQVPDLVSSFDFAVDEQCAQHSECDALTPFISAGKAVFNVEYNLPLSEFCSQSAALGLSSMRKDTSLDAPRWPCTSGTATG
jgi:hypothetical protein